jgi:hypothetical protein
MIRLSDIELWPRLHEAIDKEATRRSEGVISGNLESLERYRFETGFLQGLGWVLDKADEIIKASHPPSDTEQQEEQ